MKGASVYRLLAVAVIMFTAGCSTTNSAPPWMGDIDSGTHPGMKPQNPVPPTPPRENWGGAEFIAGLLQMAVR